MRMNHLRQANHSNLADYYATIDGVVCVTSLIILLPRTRNSSRSALVRTLGRLNMLIRYFLAAGVAEVLLGIGYLLEKSAA